MLLLISILWFIRQKKTTLFWLYLWQLKEYHIGRFLDHFRTDKGKKIFSNQLFLCKIALFLYALALFFYPGFLPWYFYGVWIFVLIVFYLFEFLKLFSDSFEKKLKKPVFTKKILFLTLANLLLTVLFFFILFKKIDLFYWFVFGLLSFDIFSPFIISGIVLLFQPLTVYLRNKTIKRAKRKREKFKNLVVVGITGSFGKTSTKEFLANILEQKFGKEKVLKTKEHQNSEMGISLCILDELKPSHQFFIVEMGAYKKGGIKLLCDIVRPKFGIVTGVNEQHLATFGSMENLLSAEGGKELVESLPEDGIAFFNAKNKYCLDSYNKASVNKKLYGENVKIAGLENIEGAKMVAKELGVSEKEIIKACQKVENEFPGIKIDKGVKDLTIIDASYSANPDGVIAHLEYLKTFSGKKIIVMPCLIELGPASKEIHEKIGRKINEVCDLAIITTKDRFKDIKKEAGEKVVFLENPKEIFEKIKSFCLPKDVVLLEGRVPETLIKLLKQDVYSLDSSDNWFKPISISLSPNTEKDDILLAFKLLFQFRYWKKELTKLSELEESFKKYLGVKHIFFFNSGRSALMAILNSLGLKEKDKVLLQAFTCNAAVNPIIWSGLEPVYVDCDEKDFNIDLEDLEKKIALCQDKNNLPKVLMVQHTFGLSVDIDKVLEVCKKNNLILIEDCAHSLGAKYKGKKVGTFGKAAFFSFSRDKIISSVYGGMVSTDDSLLAEKISKFHQDIEYPSNFWIFQQLLHPVLMNRLVLPSYKIFGKYLLVLLQWVKFLSKAVHWKEKQGKKPVYFPKRMPSALAILALNQFEKIERFNTHRKKITDFYYNKMNLVDSFNLPKKSTDKEHVFLRFAVKHPKAHQIIKESWQKNILLGDWYDSVIAPHDTDLSKMKYQKNSCPKAESLVKETLNLPTHINVSQKQAEKIITFLEKWK